MLGLECNCKKHTFSIKVNADYTDPIWCCLCNYNFDIDQLCISEELKKELIDWACEYGEWLDLANEVLLENAIEIEQNHNVRGKYLTDKLKSELGDDYTLTFVEADIVDTFLSNNKT